MSSGLHLLRNPSPFNGKSRGWRAGGKGSIDALKRSVVKGARRGGRSSLALDRTVLKCDECGKHKLVSLASCLRTGFRECCNQVMRLLPWNESDKKAIEIANKNRLGRGQALGEDDFTEANSEKEGSG